MHSLRAQLRVDQRDRTPAGGILCLQSADAAGNRVDRGVLGALVPQRYDRMEDAFEWIFVLLLCLYVLAVGELWRRTDFRAGFSVLR